MANGKSAAETASAVAAEPTAAKEIHFTSVAWKFYGEQSEAVRAVFDERVGELAAKGKL